MLGLPSTAVGIRLPDGSPSLFVYRKQGRPCSASQRGAQTIPRPIMPSFARHVATAGSKAPISGYDVHARSRVQQLPVRVEEVQRLRGKTCYGVRAKKRPARPVRGDVHPEWVAEAPPAHSTQNGRHEKDARWVAVLERQQLCLGPRTDSAGKERSPGSHQASPRASGAALRDGIARIRMDGEGSLTACTSRLAKGSS
ncbi:hypothetical protein ACCO45_004816 [Purpureocillium lilacinum]|uniref:Uncharacterized protein n=1 Tax=Purpureocillium lilacinum TaxID=33203 RepID=A0ACC4DVW5_PURLI